VSADKKLPALYLMDSIMKNVRQSNYLQLFAKNIVNNFVRVFEKVSIVILLTFIGIVAVIFCLVLHCH